MEDDEKNDPILENPTSSSDIDDDDEYMDDYNSDYDYLDSITEDDHNANNSAVVAPLPNPNYEQRYTTFDRIFNCYPLSFIEKSDMKTGNKIIMSEEALMFLVEAGVSSPFMFEIRNMMTGKISHCGVYEFTGVEEKSIFLPEWMMENLGLGLGDTVNLRSTRLRMGTKIKLQPHTMDFLEIKEPKAVLEKNLRNFCCLTTGDTVMINHEWKSYYVNVVETEPRDAICITDTDCEVDFAPPLDYKEPERPLPKKVCCEEVEKPEELNGFTAFTGSSSQLGGEVARKQEGRRNVSATSKVSSMPMENPIAASGKDMAAVQKFVPFSGASGRFGGGIPVATEPASVLKAATTMQKHKEVEDFEEPEEERMRGAMLKKQKFHPFTGLSGRLDGNVSAASELSSVADIGGTSKAAMSMKWMEDLEEPEGEGRMKKEEIFQPFTGKKYLLTDS